MKYMSINELDTFDFKDAVIKAFHKMENTILIELEAVIVKANNSQNTNFTTSYAGTCNMTLKGAILQKAILEGYRYYDANDVLKEEVPDTPLEGEALQKVLRELEGAYLWAVVPVCEKENTTGHYLYQLGIEKDEDISYWLQIEFLEGCMEWDRYMNRVQD